MDNNSDTVCLEDYIIRCRFRCRTGGIRNMANDNCEEKKRWSLEELSLLKKFYPLEGEDVYKRLPGRTKKSCKNKAMRMKLTKKQDMFSGESIEQEKTNFIEKQDMILEAPIEEEKYLIRKWMPYEDRILKLFYPAEGSRVYMRLENRTAESCRARAAVLKIRFQGGNETWTSKENEILQKYYVDEGGDVCKRLPGRTKAACINRAAKLGIQQKQYWTKEEDAIIMKHYPQEGKAVVKRLPGRTLSACQKRAYQLNVSSESRKSYWTKEEDDIICKFYPKGGVACVQKHLPGRTAQACKSRAMTLGIMTKAKNTRWTNAEKDILKKYYKKEGGEIYKRLPGRSRNACVSKASKLGLVYGEEMYHGPVLSDWITRTVTENIKEIDTSMLESKVLINLDGSAAGITLRAHMDKNGKIMITDDGITLERVQIEEEKIKVIAESFCICVDNGKLMLACTENNAKTQIFRLILCCYALIHYV